MLNVCPSCPLPAYRIAYSSGCQYSALLNVIENLMNMYYLYLAHYAQSPVAPVLGFASIVMTLSKTVLYWAQEYYCGCK